MTRRTLLLATHNRGKLTELRALLADLPIELVSLADQLPGTPQAVEDGETFVDNARLKARAAAAATGLLTLAEDAGLEVDELNGRPGVHSARYAGADATSAENNTALLRALEGVPTERRTANFRAVMVLIDPETGQEDVVEGRCEGVIGYAPRGHGGFGYDPLFMVAGRGCTMAELSEEQKNQVSHRARAILAMRPVLANALSRRI